MGDWCTIESDPGVFTSLIESFGVQNAELAELWSLDDDSLAQLLEGGPVYGLIFLFKWVASSPSSTADAASSSTTVENKPLVGEEVPPDLFFAKQVTTNACATQAILSVLLNAPSSSSDSSGNDESSSGVVLGPTLEGLKQFTQSFPPDLRGEAIGASEEIRTAHNSFARTDSFLAEQKTRVATEDDDVFHFVAYVPHTSSSASGDINQTVYELDGLQPGPIGRGSYHHTNEDGDDPQPPAAATDLDWLRVARTAIQERIEAYATSEIKFNLMAVVHDRRVALQTQLASLQNKQSSADDDHDHDESQVQMIQAQLVSEQAKRAAWDAENARRRHNYLPFCVELLRGMAESGKLPELTKAANDRVALHRQIAMAKRMAQK